MGRARTGVVLAVAAALLVTLAGDPTDARRRRRAKRRARPVPAIPALTLVGLPNVQSSAALVIDLDDGTILYGKDPDRVRPIASTGKIFVAMVARRRGFDPEGVTQITMEDARHARGGSRTHLDVNLKFKNGDLLRAMLVASDNRAVTAVGRAVGLSPEELVAEMNALARELGLNRTSFTDPTGLNGNVSTAREMARALARTLEDPVLAEILATRYTSIHSVESRRPRTVYYANTNRVLHRDRHRVLGGKTGFTNEAGYCLVTGVEMNGRRLAFVFLGAEGELTRFADYSRVVGWMESLRGVEPTSPASPGSGDVGDGATGTAAMRAQKSQDSR